MCVGAAPRGDFRKEDYQAGVRDTLDEIARRDSNNSTRQNQNRGVNNEAREAVMQGMMERARNFDAQAQQNTATRRRKLSSNQRSSVDDAANRIASRRRRDEALDRFYKNNDDYVDKKSRELRQDYIDRKYIDELRDMPILKTKKRLERELKRLIEGMKAKLCRIWKGFPVLVRMK